MQGNSLLYLNLVLLLQLVNKLFYILAYLTLTFDLVTLTLGQLQYLININPMYDFDQDPIIRSWYKDEMGY